jgi:hypothetical protein
LWCFCANKAGKERKKLEKQQKEKENLLQKYSNKIAEVQTRNLFLFLKQL